MTVALQLRSFLIVGALCTLLQYIVLLLLVHGASVNAPLASSIGFVASALVNFVLNHRFTFASRVGYRVGLTRFAVVAASGLGLTSLLMVAGVNLLGIHYFFSQVLTTGVVLIWNFTINRWWTFEAAGVNARGEA